MTSGYECCEGPGDEFAPVFLGFVTGNHRVGNYTHIRHLFTGLHSAFAPRLAWVRLSSFQFIYVYIGSMYEEGEASL